MQSTILEIVEVFPYGGCWAVENIGRAYICFLDEYVIHHERLCLIMFVIGI